MELRHIRYFVAVAETGSVTVAAEQRLHTSQPSLSRQIRDLEDEVGFPLLSRSARGMDLTPAGQAFLIHARIILAQCDAGLEAARRAAKPAKAVFALGFLTGEEMTWLPRALKLLRDELPNIDVKVSSDYSPDLADALARGKLDAAFLRAEDGFNLEYHVVAQDPLVMLMPSDHHLASRETIRAEDIVGEPFIGLDNKASKLRGVTDDYLKQHGISVSPTHGVDNLAMAMSLVASTRGIALMPSYAKNLLPWSVVSRPLAGDAPTIDLVLGYSKTNSSHPLKVFLSRLSELSYPASTTPIPSKS